MWEKTRVQGALGVGGVEWVLRGRASEVLVEWGT